MWPTPEDILTQMLLDFGVEGTVQSIPDEGPTKFIELGMVGPHILWDIRPVGTNW